jgi:hypothetical protein
VRDGEEDQVTAKHFGASVSLLAIVALATACTGGSATATPFADVYADASQPGAVMDRDQLGANLALYFDESSSPSLRALFEQAGIGLVRWPGGSLGDTYHWRENEYFVPHGTNCNPIYANAGVAFDSLVRRMVVPGRFDMNVTVNYGSNLRCTAGGSAAEAAAWVRESNREHGYRVKYWTIGNEQYFNETNPTTVDFNVPPNDAHEYATRVADEFYPQMKAVDPSIQIGVDVVAGTQNGPNVVPDWDEVVLRNATYDFVEMHYYPDVYDDDRLLQSAPDALASYIETLRRELAAAHHELAPIYLGEFDTDTAAGKQSISIVDALFVGMTIGEVTKAGVPMASIYEGVSDCPAIGRNAPNLYGWQRYGSFGMYAAAEKYNACEVPPLTAFPKARAMQLAHLFVVPGQRTLATTSESTLVRAYGATHGNGGYAFMLFNLDRSDAATESIGVEHAAAKHFKAVVTTYGKAQYDRSRAGVWSGPVSRTLANVTDPLKLVLPPWSMTVLTLAPVTP